MQDTFTKLARILTEIIRQHVSTIHTISAEHGLIAIRLTKFTRLHIGFNFTQKISIIGYHMNINYVNNIISIDTTTEREHIGHIYIGHVGKMSVSGYQRSTAQTMAASICCVLEQ